MENIPRMLPDELGAEIKVGTWEVNPIFTLLKNKGSLQEEEMYSIFNMGIGMVLSVQADKADELLVNLSRIGEEAKKIGRVVRGKGVRFT